MLHQVSKSCQLLEEEPVHQSPDMSHQVHTSNTCQICEVSPAHYIWLLFLLLAKKTVHHQWPDMLHWSSVRKGMFHTACACVCCAVSGYFTRCLQPSISMSVLSDMAGGSETRQTCVQLACCVEQCAVCLQPWLPTCATSDTAWA